MFYDDKVVWITGASSGIGEALTDPLLRAGATVTLTARRADKLQALKRSATHPERVHIVAGDLADPDGIEALAAQAMAAAGRIDILINNAGISQRARAVDTRMEDVRRLMEINVFAPIALTKSVLPHMLARGGGRIVIISSVVGYVGTPLRSSYAASKHAVRGYFDSLRAELHGSGVGVNIVCPGYVRTDISEHAVAAGGRVHGKRDRSTEQGISPVRCADAILAAVARGQSEVTTGGREILANYAKRFFPGLLERVLPRQAPS